MSSPNEKHPDSTFNAEYPFNQATITRSGHEFHVNDTPGSESLRVAHTSGTYVEMGVGGRMDISVISDTYENVVGGKSEVIGGQKEVMIKGALKEDIYNSAMRVVKGNYQVGVDGNYSSTISGTHSTNVNGDHKLMVGHPPTDVNNPVFMSHKITQVYGDDNNDISGDQVNLVGGTKVDSIMGDWAVTSSGSVEIINDVGSGLFHVKSKTITFEASSINFVTPFGTISIGSDGINFNTTSPVNINASTVNISATANVNINQLV